MKRQIFPSTSAAIGWWAANPNALKADCFAISLPTGQILRATEGQWDLTVPVESAATLQVTVPGTAAPWQWGGSLNTGYHTGLGDGTAPVVVPLGGAATVSVSASGTVFCGNTLLPTNGPAGMTPDSQADSAVLPASYAGIASGTADFMGLVGAFCDSLGNVLSVVFLGASATVVPPSGAAVLQLGINDWKLSDNTGFFTVSVSLTNTSTTYYATQHGRWSRGKITSDAGFKCQANVTTLSLVPQIGAVYPGLNIGVLNAALNHLFDGAQVWVYTAYMPAGQYGNVQVVETKFQGRITKTPKLGRLLCQFEVADPLFILNQKVPSRLLQSSCYKSFADSNCGLSAANYTIEFTAASTSTQYALIPTTAFAQADGYFTQGVVTCLTGANAGLSQTVKIHKSGALTLIAPWLLPVSAGDTFSVTKGCDQTPTTCAGMTWANGTAEPNDWQVRFGGTPYLPPPSLAI